MAYARAIGSILFGTVAAMLAACAGAAPAGPMATTDITYAQLPARLCLDADAATWQGLRRGATRLALHVSNHTPSRKHSPTFTVRLAGDDKARRDVETLTLSVDNVTEAGPVPQHFLINLAQALDGVAQTPRICVELDVERTALESQEAERRVTISADWKTVAK